MSDPKLTRIGNSPTVRGEQGQILATFFTEKRGQYAGRFMLQNEAVELLRDAANKLPVNTYRATIRAIEDLLHRWDHAA